MRKITAEDLRQLGAPDKPSVQEIERWFRELLQRGMVRLPDGVFELRGSGPVVTTLGAIKGALSVALETVKQGLRPLEMEHWVLLVDGAHTRLLGPPRLKVSTTKNNLWGSVGRSIEVRVTDTLDPLECIDYQELFEPANVIGKKRTILLQQAPINWRWQVRTSGEHEQALRPGASITVAAGSAISREGESSGVLESDLTAEVGKGPFLIGRSSAKVRLAAGEAGMVSEGGTIWPDRACLIRMEQRETGIAELVPSVEVADGQVLNWGADYPWLRRFPKDHPLILMRRAIYVTVRGIIQPNDSGSEEWQFGLGIHDCFLDGLIPYQAGQCRRGNSPDRLIEFLEGLGEKDSLREAMLKSFGIAVDAADVRIAPKVFASSYERDLLMAVARNPEFNQELLSSSVRLPCWTQVGAYYRAGDRSPWEVTREVYFNFVDVHYHQARVVEPDLRERS